MMDARAQPGSRSSAPERADRRQGAEPAAGGDIGDLRRTLTSTIEHEVRANNLRAALWLADRLKLVTPAGERTPDDELRELLSGLTPDELEEFQSLRDET